MRIPRIHVRGTLRAGTPLVLDEAPARHVHQVLRLAVGDALVVFDGGGGEYRAHINRIDRREVEVQVGEFAPRDVESRLVVHLGQGISRGERMDFTLQKAVELGVAGITPLYTERCVVKLTGERSDKRGQHWQAVVTAACEQSGRTRLPGLSNATKLADWLRARDADSGLRVLLDPCADVSLSALPRPAAAVTLLIGPEGGLSPEERALAGAHGFIGTRLGPRILRTETAALAALAAMQVLWGDF